MKCPDFKQFIQSVVNTHFFKSMSSFHTASKVFLTTFICVLISQITLVRSTPTYLSFTDADFEHKTQAATGQTTGVWLIKFCKSCRDDRSFDDPVWRKVSLELVEQHNVFSGMVDLDQNPKLAKRFAIEESPTYLLFRNRRMFKVQNRNTVESIVSYASKDFEKDNGVEVPPPPSFMDGLGRFTEGLYKNNSLIIKLGVGVGALGWLMLLIITHIGSRKRKSS